MLLACAHPPSPPAVTMGPGTEVVPVRGVMPMDQPEAKAACPVDAASPPQIPSPTPIATTPTPGGPESGGGAEGAAGPATGFCVWYEHQGKSYTVVLPQDPGPTLSLQMPAPPLAAGYGAPAAGVPVGVVPVAPVGPWGPMGMAPYPWLYPPVFFYGGYYRPRVYVPPPPGPVPPRYWQRPIGPRPWPGPGPRPRRAH